MATATVSAATITENNVMSYGNRQRAANVTTTATLWVTQQRRQQQQQQMLVRKQNSFIEAASNRNTRGYLQRGVSLNRCAARPLATGARTQNYQQQQQQRLSKRHAASIDQELHIRSNSDSVGKCKDLAVKTAQGSSNGSVGLPKQRSIVAWSSTSSLLLKSLDDELAQLNASLQQKQQQQPKHNNKSTIVNGAWPTKDTIKKPKPIQHSNSIATIPTQTNAQHKLTETNVKADVKKTNLNIVLAQTIKATTEQEFAHSDIESSTEAHSPLFKRGQAITGNNSTNNSNNNNNTATYRRAQFQLSRNTTTVNISSNSAATTTTATTVISTTTTTVQSTNTTTNNSNNLPAQISPALTVRRRPPLVRAMSAPVRTLDAKNVNANSNNNNNNNNNKRKPRRRKLNARNNSCDKSDANEYLPTTDNNINEVGIIGAGKPTSLPAPTQSAPLLSRSKSVAAADVITLVSLISSEGSDSEKEDNSTTTTTTNSNSDNSPTRGGRAPTLRKAGKSVSFQEHYPSSLQLASKEYSHMLRRGSIAPFTARLRANRPPTAPPVSIFMLDSGANNNNNNNTNSNYNNTAARTDKMTSIGKQPETQKSEPGTAAIQENSDTTVEYVYPDYVRSIKERECWKLYQKMSAKGVSVTYDTILRGMLTPTEFRQLQKQRENDEAKKRALAALEDVAQTDANAKPTTAIERLSEALLKK